MYVWWKVKKIVISLQWEEELSLRINVHKDWLRDHSSRAPCEIEMLIRGILKSWFWISLHQGTLSILCFRIQGYMLSLMNKIDSYLLLPLCVEMQNHIFQHLVLEWSSISCLYIMWLSFRIKEKLFSWCSSFLQ